jgi:hypothetical protein
MPISQCLFLTILCFLLIHSFRGKYKKSDFNSPSEDFLFCEPVYLFTCIHVYLFTLTTPFVFSSFRGTNATHDPPVV